MPVCCCTRSASDAKVLLVAPMSMMRSGLIFSTTSTLAVLPRPVRRPNSGSSAYFFGTNAASLGRKARVQPTSVSGAMANTATLAGGPAT
jgi:hypothetical protein